MSKIVAHILRKDMAEIEHDSNLVKHGLLSEEDSDPEADESSDDVVLASLIDYAAEDNSDEERF